MSTSRVQLALNVTDLEAATRFYTDLFGVGPAKQRTGYANFEIADPPLKLVLFENPGAASPLNHLGVEVASTGDVVAAAERFERRRAGALVRRVGPLLPRRAGQGVGRRPRRPARRLGVLHRPGRRPGPGHRRRRRAPAARRRRRGQRLLRRRGVRTHDDRRRAVVVEDLHVAYGTTWALDGIDLDVARGSTLGVLGHNGAGKTTLIRVLTTLVRPNAGRVTVDGFDVVADADQVRRRIGVTGQYAGLDEFLTGRENLELVGRLTGLGRARPPTGPAT